LPTEGNKEIKSVSTISEKSGKMASPPNEGSSDAKKEKYRKKKEKRLEAKARTGNDGAGTLVPELLSDQQLSDKSENINEP
jgi:hypothetical protein